MDFTWSNGIPPLFADASFDTFEDRPGAEWAAIACREYADTFTKDTRGGLYIHGPIGSGKSHLAAAVLRSIAGRVDSFDSGHGRFIEVDELVELMRKPPIGVGFREVDPLQMVMVAPFLVLDGVGGEVGSEQVRAIIYHRYSHCLPTVVTTTLAPDNDLVKALGAGVCSRLAHMCEPVEMCDLRLAANVAQEG